MQHLQSLFLTVLPRYNKASWDASSLISRPHLLSILIKNFHERWLILYYHVANHFHACLIWLVMQFWFQNMFWKNINCFRFWWKTYTKRCTSNYVISRVKRLSSPALCGWSGAFNFRIWEGVCVTIGNPAFFLSLYLTALHFRGELQHGGDVNQQKIKCRPIRTQEIGSVSLSDVLYVIKKTKHGGENRDFDFTSLLLTLLT